jgi:glyoxylase-like metal-dependent hydrolase (beta-lactamase superfamily II)
LIKCTEGYLLLDTSFPEYYGNFIEELNRIKVDVSEIKYLLLTHYHDDHTGFAAKLKENTGCIIIAHENAFEPLKNGSGLAASSSHPLNTRVKTTMMIYNKLKRRDFKISPVILDNRDIIIDSEKSDILRQFGIDGMILYTPGHTNDSISVILDNGVAFVGDVCMNFLNFCGIKYRPIWLYDMNLVFKSWQKIIEHGAKIIYPAHGKPFSVDKLVGRIGESRF